MLKMSEVTAFYGYSPLSNFHRCYFTIDGYQYNCVEQYYQARKCYEFNDEDLWFRIMDRKSPSMMKKDIKHIKGFNRCEWFKIKEEIMYTGLKAKFTQNEYLGKFLLNTDYSILGEASPYDLYWGIGLNKRHPMVKHKVWPGKNRLGELLMVLRRELRKNPSIIMEGDQKPYDTVRGLLYPDDVGDKGGDAINTSVYPPDDDEGTDTDENLL